MLRFVTLFGLVSASSGLRLVFLFGGRGRGGGDDTSFSAVWLSRLFSLPMGS